MVEIEGRTKIAKNMKVQVSKNAHFDLDKRPISTNVNEFKVNDSLVNIPQVIC